MSTWVPAFAGMTTVVEDRPVRNLLVNADRIAEDIDALAAITEPGRPYTRRAFTSMFLRGRAWLAVPLPIQIPQFECKSLGFAVRRMPYYAN